MLQTRGSLFSRILPFSKSELTAPEPLLCPGPSSEDLEGGPRHAAHVSFRVLACGCLGVPGILVISSAANTARAFRRDSTVFEWRDCWHLSGAGPHHGPLSGEEGGLLSGGV